MLDLLFSLLYCVSHQLIGGGMSTLERIALSLAAVVGLALLGVVIAAVFS